jgi:threonine/homoserine/homoserine lactone efflux protein
LSRVISPGFERQVDLMQALTAAIVFLAGFLIMTPVGPVSTICIRRALILGPLAGVVAGAGDAIAVAVYATLGVTGSTLIPRFFAHYSTVWHIVIALVLALVAVILWKAPPIVPKPDATNNATLVSGFGAALAIALANPADIVLFGALFAGLGVAVTTPADHVLFCASIFLGGCTYWLAVALILNHWRTSLTAGRVVWLNRASAALMLTAACASLASLTHPTA